MKLAITCGDPAGVGPEIIARWLESVDARELKGITLIGPQQWLDAVARPGVQTLAVGSRDFVLTPGQPTITGAKVALEALEVAASGTAAGDFDAVVTAPVSKTWLQKAGYPFPGQTEFFADRWGGEPSMAFAGGRLQVTLVTWHIPLQEVPQAITRENLGRACLAAGVLAKAMGATVPKIAVCGLNPHAGEGGLLGSEEVECLNPWLAQIRLETGLELSDCLPADTVFHRQLQGEFHGIVALYHDQGLAPLKAIDFDQAVNCTLGLPHIRTSPDHGTAFGIAGKGVANWQSFASAVNLARKLTLAKKRDC